MVEVKSNLEYVERCLKNSAYQENKPMLQILLIETIEAVKANTFKFHVPYTKVDHHSHIVRFKKLGKQNKAKLIADLQELQRELGKKQPNEKRALQLVCTMLKTNFYQDYTQAKIDNWQPLRNSGVQYEKLFVS